jgi:hypothetical protein
MMGHREKLTGGDEYDAFSRYWRRFLNMNRHPIKAMFSRRVRRKEKQRLSILRSRTGSDSKSDLAGRDT